MDSNKYSVKVGIKLDDKATANIQKELNEKLKDEKFEVSFSSKGLDDISKKIDEISSKLEKVSENGNFKKTGDSAKNAAKGVDKLNQNLDKTNKHLKNQAFATDNWAYNWSKAMQSFLTYNTVTQFFNNIMNGIKDMIGQVKELDDALVELQKVTDLEGESLQRFIDDAYEAGKTVAKTGTEMIEAATSFAKAGYKDEALELGTIAAMYTNIADEAIDASVAADMIIAQMKAFNIEASDSIHIIDAINEVSNNYAVSSSDIASNLGKASAVMANAGNSMEQYIGLMTAATEVTRNASKAANGLKTLTLRLQGMNDEGEEDLELMSQMDALFKKLGISAYNSNGELKNTYEMLEALASVYGDLTNAEKAYVTETIAGKYQAQNAAAILSNWGTAVSATATAMNSAGSAAKENEKVLNSVQGHLQQLGSEWEKFSKNIISSDLIKWFVDLGTKVLQIANSDFVKFNAKAAALVILLASAKKAITVVITTLKTLKLNLLDSYKYQVLLYAQSKNQTIQNYAQAASYLGLAGSIKALTLAMLSNPLFIAGGAALIITGITTAISKYNEKIQEGIDLAKESAETYDEEMKNVEALKSEITELKEKLDSGNISTEDAKSARKRLLEIQSELINKYGIEKDKVDLLNSSLEENINLLNTIPKSEANKWLQENAETIKKATDYMEQVKKWDSFRNGETIQSPTLSLYGIDIDDKDYKKWYSALEKVGQEKKSRKDAINEYRELSEQVGEYGKSWGLTEKQVQDAQAGISETIKRISYDGGFRWSKNRLDDYEKIYNESAEKKVQANDEYRESYINLTKAINDYNDAIAGGDKNKAEDAKKTINETIKKMDDSDALDSIKDYFHSLINDVNLDVSSLIKDNTSDLQKKVETAFKAFHSVSNDDVTFKEQVTELTKNGKLTKKALKEIMDYYDEFGTYMAGYKENDDTIKSFSESLAGMDVNLDDLYNYFLEVAGGVDVTTKSFEDLNSAIDAIQSAYSTVKTAIEEYNSTGYLNVDTMQSLLSLDGQYLELLFDENGQLYENEAAYRNLINAEMQEMLIKQINDLQNYINDLAATGSQIEAEAGSYETLTNAIKENNVELAKNLMLQKDGDYTADEISSIESRMNAISNLWKYMNNTITKAPVSSGGSSSRGSGSSSKSEKEWWEKEYDALKSQFDYSEITIEQYIGGLEGLLSRLDKGSDAWKKINKELQKQRLDKVKDDYDAGRISLNQYIISLQNLQQAYKAGTDAWNDLASAIKKAKLDQLKEQQNDLKAALSAVNNTLDKQIDKYEEAKDAADKKYDDEIEKLEELQDKLDDQDDSYQRAQQAVADYLDEQMSAMEKQRDTVETYYDNVLDAIEKMNEKQQESLELAEAYEALMNAMTQKTKKVYKEGLGKELAEYKDNYIGQMLEAVQTEVRLNLRWCVYG